MSFPTICLYKVESTIFAPMLLESLVPLAIGALVGLHVWVFAQYGDLIWMSQ